METSSVPFPLFLSQLFNLLVSLAWLLLLGTALWRLRFASISAEAKALWAGLIIIIPFLGAIAFWVVAPGRSVAQLVRKSPYVLPAPGHWEMRRSPVDVKGVEMGQVVRWRAPTNVGVSARSNINEDHFRK
jgi:hypothetical protein